MYSELVYRFPEYRAFSCQPGLNFVGFISDYKTIIYFVFFYRILLPHVQYALVTQSHSIMEGRYFFSMFYLRSTVIRIYQSVASHRRYINRDWIFQNSVPQIGELFLYFHHILLIKSLL